MSDDSHDLKLAILRYISTTLRIATRRLHLEAFVLQDSLDSCIFSIRSKFRLKDHPEGTVPYDLALCILHLSCFSRKTVLNSFAHDFCAMVSLCRGIEKQAYSSHPPYANSKTPPAGYWKTCLVLHGPGKRCSKTTIVNMVGRSSEADDRISVAPRKRPY